MGFAVLVSSEHSVKEPFMKVHPRVTTCNIWWEEARTEVEAYLLRGAVNAIIDTGPVEVFASPLSLSLGALNLTLNDIDLILNTHWHPDHTGGDGAIKAAAKAGVLIHKNDAIFLEDPRLGFDRYRAPVIEKLMGPEHLVEAKKAAVEAGGERVAVDRYLDDDDVIEIGDGVELRVIHLPGHSPGSVGFYWEQEAILFTGDSVSGLHDGYGSLPIICDVSAYKKSIQRLLEMPLQLLLCGHPYRAINLPSSPIRRGSEIKEYLRDSLEVAKRIEEAAQNVEYRGEEGSLIETIDMVVAQLPEKMGFKMAADLASPLHSATTVYFCLYNPADEENACF
jgi:glyoxylase-like metal-dependent hydrolase (beta-lactamase superfamily II)